MLSGDIQSVLDQRCSFPITMFAPVDDDRSAGLVFAPKTVELSFTGHTYPGLKPGKVALVESFRHGPHTRREYRQRYVLMDSAEEACEMCDRLMQDPKRNPDTVYFVVSGDKRRGSYSHPVATAAGSRIASQGTSYNLKELFLQKKPREKKGASPKPEALVLNPVAGDSFNLHDTR